MNEENHNFLKKIREELGVRQTDLAIKSGVSKQSIYAFETYKQKIGKENLEKIAKALQVSINYILTGNKYDEEINSETKNRIKKSMMLAEIYRDKYDKDTVIDIASEIYNFLNISDSIKQNEDCKSEELTKFNKTLRDHFVKGLAANSILNSDEL